MRAGTPDLKPLTGLRGLAAWYVVLFHIRLSTPMPAPLLAVLGKGYLAVDLFFMLSGFVLWLNYAERLRGEGLAGAPAFLWRRVARIWPLHLFVLGGAVAFALALVAAGRPNPVDYPFSQLPLHLLLVQNWGFTDDLAWNDPAWSISCELAAYLLLPLLCLSVDWRRLPVGALVLVLLLLAGALALIFGAAALPRLGDDIPHFGLVRCLVEFAMGTILCALWQQGVRPLWPALGAVSAAIGWAAGLPEPFAVPLLFAGLLLALANSRLLSDPVTLWLGEVSYSIYLAHFLLFVLFKLLFVSDPAHVPGPMLGLFLLLVLAASALLHRFVERPAQRLLLGLGTGAKSRGLRAKWTVSTRSTMSTTSNPASPAAVSDGVGAISIPTATASPTAKRSTG